MFSTQILKWGSFSFSLLNFGSRVIQLASWTILCLDRDRDHTYKCWYPHWYFSNSSTRCLGLEGSPLQISFQGPSGGTNAQEPGGRQGRGLSSNLGYFSASALVASKWWVCSGGQHCRLWAKETAALLSPICCCPHRFSLPFLSSFVPLSFFFLLFLINQSLLFGQLCCSDLRLCSQQLASSVGDTHVPEC